MASYRGLLLDYSGSDDADFAIAGFLASAVPTGGYRFGEMTLNLRLGAARRGAALPLASCLMVTSDRLELARLSVGCFQRQTWPNRELVVLDGSADDGLRDWIASLADPRIRWISSRGTGASLGDLRNQCIDAANGDVLCIWDDDDLHHPLRVEISLLAMRLARAPVCLLGRETLWMVPDRRLGILARGPWPQENSLVVARSAGLRYPSKALGEDTPAVRDLLTRHQAILVNAPELYVYIIHGSNTWDRAHAEKLWSVTADRAESEQALAARLSALSRVFPISEYVSAVRERGARLHRGEAHAAT
jgi:hypothetical protein